MVTMRKLNWRCLAAGLFSVALMATPSGVSAKGKTGPVVQEGEYRVWLDQQEVADLLTAGAFWCMEPQGDTCTFSAIVSESEAPDFVYLVVSLWNEETFIREYYDAYVREDGVLCEPSVLDFKRIVWTDLNENPIDAQLRDEFRAELSEWYGEPGQPDRCYRYTHEDSADPHMITQYFVDENGDLGVDTIKFIVDYSANAEASYTLRWE